MAEGERATGTPNTIYDLASVLFHALEGGASYDTYIEDAEREGDEELTGFFRRIREEDRDRASEARLLIAERTLTVTELEGVAVGASPRPESSDDFPGTKPIEEEVSTSRTGEVPPPPEEVPPERAGEVPTAEEVPPPRAEEVPSGTPSRALPEDVQRGTTTSSRPEEASPRSADAEGETNIPADEADVTAEEVPPMSNVPRVPQSTVPLPDEDLIAETRGVPPDAPAEGEDVATPAQAPREEPPPGEKRPERRGL